jgi:hypothetical protein
MNKGISIYNDSRISRYQPDDSIKKDRYLKKRPASLKMYS